MKKIILIVLVSVACADNIYIKNSTVYKNCKLVEESEQEIKVELYKNDLKYFYIPKMFIKEIIPNNPDTSKKSSYYVSKPSSKTNLVLNSNFNSEQKKIKKKAEEIAENDYNIAVSSYVEQEDTREIIDITELNKKISEIVKRQSELRTEIDKIVAEIESKK